MKFTKICLPAVMLSALCGCSTTRDCIDDVVICTRNKCYAEQAWCACASVYDDVDCKCDFAKGFKDGYAAVAGGGSICQPAMPPKSYWRFYHQNPEGQARMLAWFNGYSHGAVAAESDGIQDWSRIVTSPTLPPYRKTRPPKAPPGMLDETVPLEELAPADGIPPAPGVQGIDIDQQINPETERNAAPKANARRAEAGRAVVRN